MVPSSSSSRAALALAGLGLLLLALCLVLAFRQAVGGPRECPPPPRPAPDLKLAAYSPQKHIRLGERLCLGINRPIFFAQELTMLTEIRRLSAEVKAAQQQEELLAAESRARGLTGEAGATANREIAAAKATKEDKQKRLDEIKTASGQMSQWREVVLFFGDERAPAKAREVDLLTPGDPWAWIEFPLVGSENASTDDAKAWRQILGGFTTSGERAARIGLATAGSDQKMRVRAELPEIRLRVYKPVIFYVGLGGLILLAAGVGWLGWNSSLLRDGGPGTQFSLGRVQMAWWLLLVTGGFLFIWLVSEQWRGVVTGGVVALLGISASTGVAARLADDTDAAPSNGFWQDLVDYRPAPAQQGPALHRVQLIVWTLILSAIFLWTVFSKLIFADFDTNLLLLVGIAGGAYVGFKFTE